MSCCCATDGTNHFFNTQAHRLEKYFRKKGLRREQKHLMQGIEQSGMKQASILEIGCGVGGLHLSLLQAGAGCVTGFDISEKMIQAARRLSEEMGMQTRTEYWQGDFVELHEKAAAADVTILDKVVCCYENFEELIARSSAKTRRIYAVSYPRENYVARFVFYAGAFVLKLWCASFHPYYHHPRRIQAAIQHEGFDKIFERRTILWTVQIFQRN